MKYMHVSKKAVLIGGRRYVNTDDLSIQDVLDNIETVLNLPTQRVDTGADPWAMRLRAKTGGTNSIMKPSKQRVLNTRFDGSVVAIFASIASCMNPSVGLTKPSLHGEQRTRNTAIDFIDTGRGSYPLRGRSPSSRATWWIKRDRP